MNISKDQFDRIKAECVSEGIERGRREERERHAREATAFARVQEILQLTDGLLARGFSSCDASHIVEEAVKAWFPVPATGNRWQERE